MSDRLAATVLPFPDPRRGRRFSTAPQSDPPRPNSTPPGHRAAHGANDCPPLWAVNCASSLRAVEIRGLVHADTDACRRILDSLPEWFGIEEANRGYIERLDHVPGFVAVDGDTVIGFVAIESHNDRSAEVLVMGVSPDRHGGGAGRALVDAVIDWCRRNDVPWLHVKTRGPSTYDDDYEKTRRFYRAVGFEPLYESLTEWGEQDAALILVMHVTPETRG